MKSMKNIVVIGGGTGSYVVLSGIRDIPDINITAIVSSADSGGSTGLLRDTFGKLPVGDIRQCLVALAPIIDTGEYANTTRELFKYRFDKGQGLKGHSFGNLFLTALTEILGSELAAIEKAAEILNIKGKVLPVTTDDVTLMADYNDGSVGVGEEYIDSIGYTEEKKDLRINKLYVKPDSMILDETKEAILNADYIILGPGDLYTSIIANLVIGGVAETIVQSKAKIFYFVNLFTRYGQTTDYTAKDHVNDLERYLNRKVDKIIVNSAEIPAEIIKFYYDTVYSVPIKNDLLDDKRLLLKDLLSFSKIQQSSSDKVQRSIMRHDSGKVKEVIKSLIK